MKRFLKKNKKHIIFIFVFLIVIASLFFIKKQYDPENLKYTEFTEMIEENKVEGVDLRGNADKIFVFTKDDVKYITDNPKTDTFKEDLLEKGIDVANEKPLHEKANSFMGTIFQVGIFLLILVVILSISSSGSKFSSKHISQKSNVKFRNIAGNEEAKKDMEYLVQFLKNPKKYKDIGAKLPKGVALFGPPGTGKTLMAKAVAGEAGVPFFYVNGSDFIEMYAGLGARRVRDLFKTARKNSPCIVFIDEIDAIGGHRGSSKQSSENDQTINALLSELDGFNSKDSVIVMIATNRLEDLDAALIRPGRFDRHVNIGLPDAKDRKSILENYAKGKKLDENVDFESLAHITLGFSGASLEALMNEAAIIAVNRGSDTVTAEDIDESYFKIAMKGNKKIVKNKDENIIKLVAYHEAGHALATKLLTNNHLHKVTIIPSTSGAGGATFSIPKNLMLISKKEILNNVRVLYAGRAAEELLKGNKDDITSGARVDIQQATNYIKSYFAELGMSSKFGMLAIENDDLYMKDAIELSNQLYDETLKLLTENKDLLDKISQELIEKETLSGKQIDDLISRKEIDFISKKEAN